MKTNMRKVARGFTLIELVVVVAVIAILAALLVPTILGQAERARASRAKSDVSEIAKAMARMRTDTGFVPSGIDAAAKATAAANCYSLANLGVTDFNLLTPAATACGATLLQNCNTPGVAPGSLCWGGPYMSPAPTKDPWATNYTALYDTTAGTSTITVTSWGPDVALAGGDDLVSIQ